MSLRGDERVFHVARQRIALWLKHKADEVEKKQESFLIEEEIIRSQDGIFLLEADELWNFVGHKGNQQWLWVVLERRSQRILAWVNGDRTAATAQRLWKRLPPPYQRDSHCFTDMWAAYKQVIPADQHTACGKASGQTNHIERWNTTLHQRVGRFVRKTRSSSQCEKMHITAIPWCIYCYNEGKSSYGQERSTSSPLPSRTG